MPIEALGGVVTVRNEDCLARAEIESLRASLWAEYNRQSEVPFDIPDPNNRNRRIPNPEYRAATQRMQQISERIAALNQARVCGR
jgi:hypothetical protein